VITQGDIYWVDLGVPYGSEPGYRRPCVVVQNDLFNKSRISTVIVCLLTTNLQRAIAPGNVTLEAGEANLTQKSVINVSQCLTIDKQRLQERIGVVSRKRLDEVLNGISLVLEPVQPPE